MEAHGQPRPHPPLPRPPQPRHCQRLAPPWPRLPRPRRRSDRLNRPAGCRKPLLPPLCETASAVYRGRVCCVPSPTPALARGDAVPAHGGRDARPEPRRPPAGCGPSGLPPREGEGERRRARCCATASASRQQSRPVRSRSARARACYPTGRGPEPDSLALNARRGSPAVRRGPRLSSIRSPRVRRFSNRFRPLAMCRRALAQCPCWPGDGLCQ